MNRRQTLEALKHRLVSELELMKSEGFMPMGKEAAPLSRELRQVMAELDSLPEEEASEVDKIFGEDGDNVTDMASHQRKRTRGQRAATSEKTVRQERAEK